MELEELDAQRTKPKEDEEWEGADTIDPEDQAIIDIKEAIFLFTTVKTVLDYVSNPDVVKRISQRERDIMFKVSEQVRTYLASVEPTYLDEVES